MIRKFFLSALTILALVSGATAQPPLTTMPNVSNMLTQCAANVPIVGNGVGASPICFGSTFGTAAFVNTGTSGATLGLLNTANTYSATQTFAAITAATINGNTFTTGTGTLTLGAGKTLTASNTLTFTGTDGSSVAFGTGGTVLYNGGALGTPSSATLTYATGLPIAGVTGWGTGVASALGTAVGSAGAPVLYNGAGGIPSSITLTNASGYPAATTSQLGVVKPDGTTITVVAGVITASGASATSITPLTTTISGGTNGDLLGVTTSGCGSGSPCLAQVPLAPLQRSYLAGLTLSTAGSSATFGIAVGTANDGTNASVMLLASAYTKTTSSWAVGTAAGALDTGSIANSTWYHVFLMQRPDTGVVDICISVTVTGCTTGGNIPAAYTLFRRIGSMKTDGSAHWIAFNQQGDDFYWITPVQDVAGTSITTTASLLTLSVPIGVRVKALLGGYAGNATTAVGLSITSPDITGAATLTAYTTINPTPALSYFGAFHSLFATNAAAQVQAVSNGTIAAYIFTEGWTDRRGRDF